jgi:hypothetical protein
MQVVVSDVDFIAVEIPCRTLQSGERKKEREREREKKA